MATSSGFAVGPAVQPRTAIAATSQSRTQQQQHPLPGTVLEQSQEFDPAVLINPAQLERGAATGLHTGVLLGMLGLGPQSLEVQPSQDSHLGQPGLQLKRSWQQMSTEHSTATQATPVMQPQLSVPIEQHPSYEAAQSSSGPATKKCRVEELQQGHAARPMKRPTKNHLKQSLLRKQVLQQETTTEYVAPAAAAAAVRLQQLFEESDSQRRQQYQQQSDVSSTRLSAAVAAANPGAGQQHPLQPASLQDLISAGIMAAAAAGGTLDSGDASQQQQQRPHSTATSNCGAAAIQFPVGNACAAAAVNSVPHQQQQQQACNQQPPTAVCHTSGATTATAALDTSVSGHQQQQQQQHASSQQPPTTSDYPSAAAATGASAVPDQRQQQVCNQQPSTASGFPDVVAAAAAFSSIPGQQQQQQAYHQQPSKASGFSNAAATSAAASSTPQQQQQAYHQQPSKASGFSNAAAAAAASSTPQQQQQQAYHQQPSKASGFSNAAAAAAASSTPQQQQQQQQQAYQQQPSKASGFSIAAATAAASSTPQQQQQQQQAYHQQPSKASGFPNAAATAAASSAPRQQQQQQQAYHQQPPTAAHFPDAASAAAVTNAPQQLQQGPQHLSQGQQQHEQQQQRPFRLNPLHPRQQHTVSQPQQQQSSSAIPAAGTDARNPSQQRVQPQQQNPGHEMDNGARSAAAQTNEAAQEPSEDDSDFKSVDDLDDFTGPTAGTGGELELDFFSCMDLFLSYLEGCEGTAAAQRVTTHFEGLRKQNKSRSAYEMRVFNYMVQKGFMYQGLEALLRRTTAAADLEQQQQQGQRRQQQAPRPRQQQRSRPRQQDQQQAPAETPPQSTAGNGTQHAQAVAKSERQLRLEQKFGGITACSSKKAFGKMLGQAVDFLASQMCEKAYKLWHCYQQLYLAAEGGDDELEPPGGVQVCMLISGPTSRVAAFLSPDLEKDSQVIAAAEIIKGIMLQKQEAAAAAFKQAEAAGQPAPGPVLYKHKARTKLRTFTGLLPHEELQAHEGKAAAVYAVKILKEAWQTTWSKAFTGRPLQYNVHQGRVDMAACTHNTGSADQCRCTQARQMFHWCPTVPMASTQHLNTEELLQQLQYYKAEALQGHVPVKMEAQEVIEFIDLGVAQVAKAKPGRKSRPQSSTAAAAADGDSAGEADIAVPEQQSTEASPPPLQQRANAFRTAAHMNQDYVAAAAANGDGVAVNSSTADAAAGIKGDSVATNDGGMAATAAFSKGAQATTTPAPATAATAGSGNRPATGAADDSGGVAAAGTVAAGIAERTTTAAGAFRRVAVPGARNATAGLQASGGSFVSQCPPRPTTASSTAAASAGQHALRTSVAPGRKPSAGVARNDKQAPVFDAASIQAMIESNYACRMQQPVASEKPMSERVEHKQHSSDQQQQRLRLPPVQTPQHQQQQQQPAWPPPPPQQQQQQPAWRPPPQHQQRQLGVTMTGQLKQQLRSSLLSPGGQLPQQLLLKAALHLIQQANLKKQRYNALTLMADLKQLPLSFEASDFCQLLQHLGTAGLVAAGTQTLPQTPQHIVTEPQGIIQYLQSIQCAGTATPQPTQPVGIPAVLDMITNQSNTAGTQQQASAAGPATAGAALPHKPHSSLLAPGPQSAKRIQPEQHPPLAPATEKSMNGHQIFSNVQQLVQEAGQLLPQDPGDSNDELNMPEGMRLKDALVQSWGGKSYYDHLLEETAAAAQAMATDTAATPAHRPGQFGAAVGSAANATCMKGQHHSQNLHADGSDVAVSERLHQSAHASSSRLSPAPAAAAAAAAREPAGSNAGLAASKAQTHAFTDEEIQQILQQAGGVMPAVQATAQSYVGSAKQQGGPRRAKKAAAATRGRRGAGRARPRSPTDEFEEAWAKNNMSEFIDSLPDDFY